MPGEFIRTFAKFFTGLTRRQQSELELAFSEAQNLKEITSLETSSRLLKRKIDQSLPIPDPTSRTAIRGAIIEWPALPDQRINFYEADVSTISNFSNFDTFPTYGTQIVLNDLTSTKFVRIRGVRRDGTTTPYSATVVISPDLFNIRSHSAEAFYIPIEGTDPVVVLGGDSSDLDYAPINQEGHSKVWGMITTYADPAVAMFGLDNIFADVVVKKKDEEGFLIDETIEWRVSMGEFFNTHSIGPFTVEHTDTAGDRIEIRIEVSDKTTLANGDPRSADSTKVLWTYISVLEVGI